MTLFRIASAVVLCALATSAAHAAPEILRISKYIWTSSKDYFGGFSGFEMADDGLSFRAVSDSGYFTNPTLTRDASGDISGTSEFFGEHILSSKGEILEGYLNDAEGLAIGTDGLIYISFEGLARVAVHDDPAKAAVKILRHPDFDNMQNNSSLESLAIDEDGTLYTFPERSGVLTRPFPVYRYADGVWDQPFGIPRDPPFLTVGADFGPQGKLYVLERHLNGIFGFQSRIRRFDLGNDGLQNEETILTSKSGEFDNLEGISVWINSDGNTVISLLSDDNFKNFQKTQIVEITLSE